MDTKYQKRPARTTCFNKEEKTLQMIPIFIQTNIKGNKGKTLNVLKIK